MKHNVQSIYAKNKKGSCGIDIKTPTKFKLKLPHGISPRKYIGLPELSEPEIMRHFFQLGKLNYCIDEGIYPLGSCTMKYNPRLNEKISRIYNFTNIHPLQPEETIQGSLEVLYQTQQWLQKLSGLDFVSLCPAAGAHGEFAGIKIIQAAHKHKNNKKTKILIPDSAHGTNPATATMCGYQTIIIPSDSSGRINIQELKNLIDQEVAAIMITNPNTCGLFEHNIKTISNIAHQYNAYLYCDGANFNAIMGKINMQKCGIDIMHFNLHKTFSTPHGGGGPGSGPIACTKELQKFTPLPYTIQLQKNKNTTYYKLITENNIKSNEKKLSIGKIKAFHGQFNVILKALTYMLSMGIDGLIQASEDAILNANYILYNLESHYDLPMGKRCMHECLITDKIQRINNKVTTHDIAKALIDYNMHPMTIYFPLIKNGCMLIEPTETENKKSLDKFIKAMKEIAKKTITNKNALLKSPKNTPVRRVDEVAAARKLIITEDCKR